MIRTRTVSALTAWVFVIGSAAHFGSPDAAAQAPASETFSASDGSATVTFLSPQDDPFIEIPPIYTDQAIPPVTLPLEVSARLNMVIPPNEEDEDFFAQSYAADFGLDGNDLNGSPVNWSGPEFVIGQIIPGSIVLQNNDPGRPTQADIATAVDLANAQFLLDIGPPPETDYSLSTLLRTFGSLTIGVIDTYYGRGSRASGSISGYITADAIEVQLEIRNLADGDEDLNGQPDPFELHGEPEGEIQIEVDGALINSMWVDLDVNSTSGFDVEIRKPFITADGLQIITVRSDSLQELQNAAAADPFFGQNSVVQDPSGDRRVARLMVSIGQLPTSILDGPEDVNPLDQFLLNTDPPQNSFVLVNILLCVPCSDPGCTVEWVALQEFPEPDGDFDVEVEWSGFPIEEALLSENNVFVYSYDTTFEHRFDFDLGDFTNSLLNNAQAGGLWFEVGDDAISFTAGRTAVPGSAEVVRVDLDKASNIISTSFAPSLSSVGFLDPGLDDGDTGGSGGGGGGCFIATAAYGTPLAEEIGLLRELRDGHMLTNGLGAAFVDSYYRLSPPVADRLAASTPLRGVVRMLLVPLLVVVSMPAASASLCAAGGIVIAAAIRRTRRGLNGLPSSG